MSGLQKMISLRTKTLRSGGAVSVDEQELLCKRHSLSRSQLRV